MTIQNEQVTTTAAKQAALSVDSKHRKTYRAILEISKSLDDIYKSSNSFLKIFQSETTLLREKLRQYCELLIFRQPLEYGKKAEEILWRRVFYEIIHIVKASKKQLKSDAEIETMYRLHLSAAYGYYNHLILRLQSEFNFNMNLDGFLDFPIQDKSSSTFATSNLNSHHLKELITKILHKLLICLGDLARYQIEYDPFGSSKLSQKYYLMALLLVPENGQPLNQLGTLFGSENYGVDAAYYYIYCLSCSVPFHGAKENLKLLFSKNRKRYEEIKSLNYLDQNKRNNYQLKEIHSKEIKKFLVLYLHIIDQFLVNYLDTSTNVTLNTNNLQELCQICLQEFNSCMFYKSSDESATSSAQIKAAAKSQITEKLSYLPNDLVFKLAIMILMTIERLKKAKFMFKKDATSNNAAAANTNTILFTAVAFAFIFFSHIINHSILRFQEDVFNLQKNTGGERARGGTIDNDVDDDEENLDSDETTKKSSSHKFDSSNTDGASDSASFGKKKKINLIYGRRRRQRNSDSDTNSQDSDSESYAFMRQQQRKPSSNQFAAKHDYLSEDEMNDLSTDEEDEEEGGRKTRSRNVSTSSSSSSLTSSSSKTETTVEKTEPIELETTAQQDEQPENLKENELLQTYIHKLIPIMDTQKSNISANFKEFSTQLFTNYSLFESKFENIASMPNEFIDNEIYKCVLNGRKQVSVPPGFENNSKEAQEIEELGKKLATFQIETDTEMSMMNSDTNANSSSNDSSSGDESAKSILKAPTKQSHGYLNDKDIKTIIEILFNNGLLPAIKIFCDWLLCNKKLIQSISQVSQTIWSRLAILLNCMPLEKDLLSSNVCQNNYVKNLISKSFETISWNTQPLAEDLLMRSFDALKLEHSLLKFDLNNLTKLSCYEENLLRICSLRRFGYSIASLSQSPQLNGNCFFLYNQELFVAHQQQPVVQQTEEQKKEQKAAVAAKPPDVDQKLKLMKEMAQLRLQAEISQLENSYKGDETNFSPYLIVEVNALCSHLKIIQDLSCANKFIIIIPISVIDSLDEMKKDSKVAREAIRWLENQFKYGNRFIRAQVQNEKIQRQTVMLKNNNKDRLLQLIDCCKYFKENHNLVDESTINMVTLLIANSSDDDQIAKTCQKEDIYVRNIVEFYEKWKLVQQQNNSSN